jgi:hypothetical protein
MSKRPQLFVLATFLQLITLVLGTSPQPALAIDKASLLHGGTLTAGNAFYRVYVQDLHPFGLGLYTATTGPAHPAGSSRSLLFGDGLPGTSFTTVHSYTTGTDYLQFLLDSFGTVTPIGTIGARTTYVLPGPPTTPDALTIVQDVKVNGTTYADSSVEVTTTVTNNGAAPVALGIRYLWDLLIGMDDGPTFLAAHPNTALLTTEGEFLAPRFESFRATDNDVNPAPPTYDVFGTVTGPAGVLPPPTAPDLLQYVAWDSAFGTAFDYTVDAARVVAISGQGNDSAVLYFFGHDSASAITIPASGQATVSASLFAQPSRSSAPALTRVGLFFLCVVLAAVGVAAVSRQRAGTCH